MSTAFAGWEALQDRIRADLAAVRPVTPQVSRHLQSHHGISPGDEASFLESRLPLLEEYEVELVLSPLFTPTQEDQARVSQLLSDPPPSAAAVEGLVERLENQGIEAVVQCEGASVRIALPPGIIRRYVRLLNLAERVLPPVRSAAEAFPPPLRDRLLALARTETWRAPARQTILAAFIEAFVRRSSFDEEKIGHLSQIVQTTRPERLGDLAGPIESLVRVTTPPSGPRFFDVQIEDRYAEGATEGFGEKKTLPPNERIHALAADLLSDLRAALENGAP